MEKSLTCMTAGKEVGEETTGVLTKQYSFSARTLLHNTGWNLGGYVAPLVVGVIAMPILVERLGIDRFGLLTLAWTVIGYLSLFDFGLGRALTKLVAEKIGNGSLTEIPSVFWNSVALLLVVGVIGGLAFAGISGWLVTSALKVPARLRTETLISFYYMAATIPIVTTAAGLRGYLEAHQEFRSLNVVRALIGVLGFVGPLSVLPFTHRLTAVIGMLSVTRVIALGGLLGLCMRQTPELRQTKNIGSLPLGPLIRFGGWLTVSNVLSPVMVSMDRFFIGSLLSLSMVAYYVTPSEMMLKILVIPMALQSVIFPAFSGMGDDSGRIVLFYRRANEAVLLVMFPFILVAVAFAPQLLSIWLGAGFAVHSSIVLQVLAIGVFINAVAHVPSVLVQSVGRPDVNAKLKLIEIPIYIALAWWLIVRFGIVGAAAAWLARVLLDSAFLFLVARRWAPGVPFRVARTSLLFSTVLMFLVLACNHVSLWLLIIGVLGAVIASLRTSVLFFRNMLNN